jgi:multiple sugar transport system permease protein
MLPRYLPTILALAALCVTAPFIARGDSAPPPVVVKVVNYDPNSPEDMVTGALVDLMQRDPRIQIEPWSGLSLPVGGSRSSLLMAIAGRTAPDIANTYFHSLNNDVNQGFYYPLNEWIGHDLDGNGQVDDNETTWDGWKNIPKLWRQVATINGKIYALPTPNFDYRAILFRTDLVRQAGLDPEHPPQTWDEFYYWCQKLTGPNKPVPGLPAPSQRGLNLEAHGFMWLPWMQAAGGFPIAQDRTSPLTHQVYTFNMEETDFHLPDGEDLAGVPPVWRANFAAPEGIAAAAFYHKLRWARWIYDLKTGEPVNLTPDDIVRGWAQVGSRKVAFSPDDIIVGVCRTDTDAPGSNASNPLGRGAVAIQPGVVSDLASGGSVLGIDPDLLSWFPFPAGGDHGQRVVQMQRHFFVMVEGVGRRPKAERDQVWAAMTAMTAPGLEQNMARRRVLTGLARFVAPDMLQQIGFGDYVNDIPPSIRLNYDQIKSGQIRTFVEPYMGFWMSMDGALEQQVLSLIMAQNGETFDYTQALRQVQEQANTGLMFGRSSESLAPYRPLAWAIGILCIVLIVVMVGQILRERLQTAPSTTGVHNNWLPWLLLAPALLLIALWSYYPLMRGMVMGFQDYKIVGQSPYVGFDNFISLCLDHSWWVSLWRTVYYVGLNMTLGFFAPIFLALMLSEVPRGKVFYRTLFFLPQLSSGLVITLLWRIMYDPTPTGFFNKLLALLNHLPFIHIPPQTWLQDTRLAMICVVVPPIWAGMGMSSLLYLAALKGVPEEIYEAAEIDGAGIWHKLTKITIPSLLPLILINFLGAFIGAFQSMGDILLLTFGGPGDATSVASMRIWIEAYNNIRFSMATSMAWMLGVFLIGFTYLQIKLLQRVEFKRSNWN